MPANRKGGTTSAILMSFLAALAHALFGDPSFASQVLEAALHQLTVNADMYRAGLLEDSGLQSYEEALRDLQFCPTVIQAIANFYNRAVRIVEDTVESLTSVTLSRPGRKGQDIVIHCATRFSYRPSPAQPAAPASQPAAKRPADASPGAAASKEAPPAKKAAPSPASPAIPNGPTHHVNTPAKPAARPPTIPAVRPANTPARAQPPGPSARKVVYHLVVVKRDDGIKPGFFTTDAQIPVMLLSHPQPRSVFRAVRDDNMDVRVITVYTCDKTNKNVRYMNAAQTVICVAEADDLVTHNGHETLCCTGAEGINYRYGGSNGLRLPEDIAAAVWPPAENNPNGGRIGYRVVEPNDPRTINRATASHQPPVRLYDALDQFYWRYMTTVNRGTALDAPGHE